MPVRATRGEASWAGEAAGLRVPATRENPGDVLAAPSVGFTAIMSPTVPLVNEGTRGRLRATPGSSRCFPRQAALPPGPTLSAPRLSLPVKRRVGAHLSASLTLRPDWAHRQAAVSLHLLEKPKQPSPSKGYLETGGSAEALCWLDVKRN